MLQVEGSNCWCHYRSVVLLWLICIPGIVAMFSPTRTYILCTFCKSEPLSWVSAQHSSSSLELVLCSELQTTWRSCLSLVATPWRTRATHGTVHSTSWNHPFCQAGCHEHPWIQHIADDSGYCPRGYHWDNESC